VDEKKLKELARESISKFKDDVKKGLRNPLQPEEMAEGWDRKPVVKQVCGITTIMLPNIVK